MDYDYHGSINTLRRGGFNAAIYAEWLNVPLISIVTQYEYAQRGVGSDVITTGETGPEEIGRDKIFSRDDYLSIPILVKISIPVQIIKPYILIGPRLDYFLGDKEDEPAFYRVYDEFSKTIIGGSFGIGLDLKRLSLNQS